MALDSRAHPFRNDNAPFYAFGGSSSSSSAHHQADLHKDGGLLSLPVGFHNRLPKGNNNNYLKLHQRQGPTMHEGVIGKVLSDSNDGSLISFEDSYEAVAGGHGCEHNSNTHHAECFGNSHQTVSSLENHIILTGGSRSHLIGKVNNRDDMLDWYYSSDVAYDQTAVHKYPTLDESCMPPNKKQCTSTATAKKSSKAKQPVASKDPQSIAAKSRRERISERLKILQELVPNGTKVDLVTMLEKAIGYVKFLQLQVKVLAADEFWPVQGGKAPELSQVKDAIDAILSSQRSDMNSASD